jgi:hypothetical protein
LATPGATEITRGSLLEGESTPSRISGSARHSIKIVAGLNVVTTLFTGLEISTFRPAASVTMVLASAQKTVIAPAATANKIKNDNLCMKYLIFI